MREIKFRAKRKLTGTFVYGSLLRNPWSEDWDYINDFSQNEISEIKETSFRVITSTIGQYTGLKDKNGKEIYEGDILKWKCSKSGSKKEEIYTVTIEWDKHHYGLTIYDKGEKWATGKSYWNECDREIIGNIYENPELL